MESSLDRYLRGHSSLPGEALAWIEKQTNIRTKYPQMLSGPVQGELLKLLVQISGARRALEIGSFTGYSSTCIALGLPEDGHLDAFEVNDELEDLMREGGYMLPQSSNALDLTSALLDDPPSKDFPEESAREILSRIRCNDRKESGGSYRCSVCFTEFTADEGETPICPMCHASGKDLETI